jgi:hypothetical protein|tara:strand:- start:2067 stop:2390 length:324 start_codon:yes stop_codon:yes gene_type:complete
MSVDKSESQLMICYSCGAVEPDYVVDDYQRVCAVCGEHSVMAVEEVIDLLNDLRLKGLIKDAIMTDYVDEDYDVKELDFEEGQAELEHSFKAFEKDYKDEYGEDIYE